MNCGRYTNSYMGNRSFVSELDMLNIKDHRFPARMRDSRKTGADVERVNMWLTFSIMLFMYGFFAYGANAAKYAGLIIAPILFLATMVLNRRLVFDEIIWTFRQEKGLSFMMMAVFLVMIVSTLLNFPTGMYTLLRYQGPVIAIGVITLCLPRNCKRFLIRAFFVIALIALAYGIYNYSWATYAHYNVHHRFDRDSNVVTVLLLPFLMSYVFLDTRKNKLRVAIVIFVMLYLLAASLWTGERGSWGAIFVEGLILAWMLTREKYLSSKTLLLIFLSGFVLTLSTGIVLYNVNKNFKRQVDLGVNLHGRGPIVKTRFPLFIQSDKIILGFGYSDDAYNDFFNAKKAPHIYGTLQNGRYHFNQDGPFYLQLFYHFGFVGLIIFITYSLYFIYRLYQLQIKGVGQLDKLYYTALLSSFVGYFIINGLFEGRTIYYMIFMYFMLMTASAGLGRAPTTERIDQLQINK